MECFSLECLKRVGSMTTCLNPYSKTNVERVYTKPLVPASNHKQLSLIRNINGVDQVSQNPKIFLNIPILSVHH